MLTVTEIFESIEGETSWVGTPTTFVRLTGCNLRCDYCDTTYAFHGGEGREVADIVEAARGWRTPAVCVTGGEPLLQPECPELISRLCDLGFTVIVETSGSRPIDAIDPRAVAIVDVKTPGSGEVDRNLWENLEKLRDRDELKFVLCDRGDYEWARDVVRDRGIVERRVFFNPAWGRLAPQDLAAWMLEDHLPVRLGLQVHKYLWGADARGR
ncbi:MAG: radical SAM protein [Acidobacteriota bacterium]